ncbi:MAG: tetratricopeptide repeat protein [Treponema sp.]|jgi:tetratricopeptide (TPR) repeat protein|nr:tetratricopeptide repeat protein [Treponema sp.]
MITDPVLNKAAYLAKKQKYESAIKLLKDGEERYYDSFKYYYLYAVICLHSGNFLEAKENFDLARKRKINDPGTMLGHAVLYLKRMNTVQAVSYYLEVQEMEPKNKIAKKALEIIRKHSASDDLSDWIASDKLKKLFPPVPAAVLDGRAILKAVLIFAAAFLILYGVLAFLNIAPHPFKAGSQRPAAEYALSSRERSEPVQVGGFYRYILTRDEAVNLYDRALSLFSSYRDEEAKININRILESNASEGLKNRVLQMLDNMEVPGFDNFNRGDNPSYSDVQRESVIYRNVHVIWRGMATNVEVTNEHTSFDLLVGYDTRTSLEGIVPVIFYSPVPINTERPLEVLGKITLVSSHSGIILEGVAIHQSGRLE